MSHKKSANTTHRTRLARRLAEATGVSYQQALAQVTSAAEAGVLPTPLDPAGMDAAMSILASLRVLSAEPEKRVDPDRFECVYCRTPLRYHGRVRQWVAADADVDAAIAEQVAAGQPVENVHAVLGCDPQDRTGGLVAFVAAGVSKLRILREEEPPRSEAAAKAIQSLRNIARADGLFTEVSLKQWATQVLYDFEAISERERQDGREYPFIETIATAFAEPLAHRYNEVLAATADHVDEIGFSYQSVPKYGHIPAPHWLREGFMQATSDDAVLSTAGAKVHKARPNAVGSHCAVCMQPVKRVPGGQGPTWIHTDTGFVAASGADPTHSLAEQDEDTLAEDRKAVPSYVGFAHEGNPVPRCTATSWRYGAGQRAREGYGPGGFNRCVKRARHESERHIDEWGNVFELDPKFRLIKNLTQREVARVAAGDGIVLIDSGGNPIDPAVLDDIYPYKAQSPDDLAEEVKGRLRQNLLVQTRNNEVLKVSEIEQDSVTAQVVYPLPPRTTVRRYSYIEAATWREPSDVMVGKYERAWGLPS